MRLECRGSVALFDDTVGRVVRCNERYFSFR